MPTPEALAIAECLDNPDFDRAGDDGTEDGNMKPVHRVGSLLVQVSGSGRRPNLCANIDVMARVQRLCL